MPARSAAVAFVFLAAFGYAPAASQPAPLRGLDAYIEHAMRDWEVPGLALAVVRNDSVIYARGYGVRELGRPDRVDEHTLFAIASTTKAMTVAALGMLADEGRLRWDDPVGTHLPAFVLHDPYVTRELTVRDLLTHRAGVSRSDQLWISAPFDRDEVLRRARHLPTVAGFRAQYGYNNIMYIAAGEVVGAASGSTWDDFLEQRLFRPLGMTRSTTRANVVETRDNVAASHTRVGGSVQPVPRRNYDNIGGAGAVFSSVHDMAQWIRLHLNEGSHAGTRLLEPRTVREIFTPHTIIRSDTTAERMFPDTRFRTYGLGWNVQDYHGRRLVHHSGSINWTRTQVGMLPEQNVGVVVITNLSTSNLQLAVMYRVLDAFLGLPARDWSGEYLAIARRGEERSALQAAEVEAARLPGTRPSLAPEAYTGTYESDLFGELTLRQENGRLVLDYSPEYTADLEHWHHDTFRATWRRPGAGRAFATFALDARGRVASLDFGDLGIFRRTAPAP
jgi:CubicO group peptidase (beta-lactamase class C family)